MAYSDNSTDILYLNALGKPKGYLKVVNFPLIRFTEWTTYLLGAIIIPLILSEGWNTFKVDVLFVVVDPLALYNEIFRRMNLNPKKIATSTFNKKMKFQIPHGIVEFRGTNRGQGVAM